MNKVDSAIIRFLMMHGMDPKKFADGNTVLHSKKVEEIRAAIVEIVNEFEISNKRDPSEYKQGVVNMGNFMLGSLTKFELVNPEMNGSEIANNGDRFHRYKNGDVVRFKDRTLGYIVFDLGPTPMIPSYKTDGWLSVYESTMFLLIDRFGDGSRAKLSGRYIVKHNADGMISYLEARDSQLNFVTFSNGIIVPMSNKSDSDLRMIVDSCDVELKLETKTLARGITTSTITKPSWHKMGDVSDYSIHFRSVVKQLISYNLGRGISEF